MEIDRGPLKTVLDFDKLKLTTPPRDRSNWKSNYQLVVRSVNGNVRVDVYCNPQDGERLPTKATLNLDPVIINTFLSGAKQVLAGEFPARGVNSFDHERNGDQRSKEVFEQGNLIFGKDPSGMFLISFKHREIGPDPVTFHFRSSRYWNVIDHTGQPLSDSDTSKAMAAGWVSILNGLIPIAVDQTAAFNRVEKAGKDGKDKTKTAFAIYAAKNASFSKGSGGGQGGGGSWKKNDNAGGSSYSKPSGGGYDGGQGQSSPSSNVFASS